MSIKSSYTLTISLSTITILSGIFLSSNIAFATDTNTSQDNVAVSIPVSCTMNGTGMNSHTANIPNGTYESEIGTTTLKSFCNDSQGFAIYAIGYTNEEYGNTTLIGANQGQTIVTGTATTTGNPDVSNWAVKLATDSTATYPITLDNSFGAYSSVPSTYTKVAHRDSGTDLGSSATGAELTTTYAAYISKGQKADTYDGKVKFTLVHPASEVPLQPQPATAGCINYFANASTAIGEMGCQSASNNAIVDLWASNFSRSGYGFAGWNTAYDYSGTFYGPNQTITTPSDTSTNGLSLYAVWVPSAGTIQNWNGCSSLTQAPTDGTANLSSVTALTDERDGNTYAVARLADGKCWMIENLRLADKDTNNNDITLSSSNTHNPSLPLTNTWFYSSTNYSDTIPTSNHLSATTDPTQTTWCTANYTSNCNDQSMLATNNTTLFTSNTSSGYSKSSDVYVYGNYYNWYSATAGHGKYGNDYGGRYTAPGDICPVGWHLPTGNTNGEYYNLNYAINDDNNTTDSTASQKIRSYPNNFVYSGYVEEWLLNRSSYGYYWSASGQSNTSAYNLYLHNANVYASSVSNFKSYGRAVRCLSDI